MCKLLWVVQLEQAPNDLESLWLCLESLGCTVRVIMCSGLDKSWRKAQSEAFLVCEKFPAERCKSGINSGSRLGGLKVLCVSKLKSVFHCFYGLKKTSSMLPHYKGAIHFCWNRIWMKEVERIFKHIIGGKEELKWEAEDLKFMGRIEQDEWRDSGEVQ